MFDLINSMFGWMPIPLRLLTGAVFVVFSVFVAVAIIKAIYGLLQFLMNVLGGLLGKVVALFT